MLTKYFQPCKALADFVEIICIIRYDFASENISPIYTYMPTHTRFLCFNLEDRFKVKKSTGLFSDRARSIIVGPQLTPVILDLGKKHTELVVILKPCALYRLLGVPLKEIIDCDYDASLFLGNEICDIVDRLRNTNNDDEKNKIVQYYLIKKLSKLKPLLPIDLAMLHLVKLQGQFSVDALCLKSCLSVRQLERQSLDRIGFPPKYFARVVRFSEAYKFKERFPKTKWLEIAHRFGYFDQMHLIRDFRHFTGENPGKINQKSLSNSVLFNSIDP